jgi:hypothetical protein
LEIPDAQENRIRFGCGFVFGFVTVAISVAVHSFASGYYVLGIASIAGLIFGVLAMKLGNRFWHNVFRWWPW